MAKFDIYHPIVPQATVATLLAIASVAFIVLAPKPVVDLVMYVIGGWTLGSLCVAGGVAIGTKIR